MRILASLLLPALFLWADAGGGNALLAQGKRKSKTGSDPNPAQATPFSAVVRAHFKEWDRNHDGKLTPEEINAAMTRPGIKGEVAAAVATLRCIERYAYTRLGKEMPPFTLEDLRQYEAAGPRVRRAKFGARGDDFDAYFKEFNRRLQATPRKLFPEKRPRLAAVKQGYIGDCFFMSMVGALVHLHPEKVRREIREVDGNKYRVKFGDAREPVEVAEPTDAEIALNSTAEGNGLWLTVLEKAFATREAQKWKEETGKDTVTGLIGEGGAANEAIAVLTGHGHRYVLSRSPEFQRDLKEALQHRLLICTTLRQKREAPPMLYTTHVYAVLDYDDKAQKITLFDPIGDNFRPEGDPCPRNGFEMKDGVFTMTLKDYERVFLSISYEDMNKVVAGGRKKARN